MPEGGVKLYQLFLQPAEWAAFGANDLDVLRTVYTAIGPCEVFVMASQFGKPPRRIGLAEKGNAK
jgi:hypothetical protein